LDTVAEPESLKLGRIPALSHVPLYTAVVERCLDDPRLLTAWCIFAVWLPIDRALGTRVSIEEWAQRAQMAPELFVATRLELIQRGLLTPSDTIPHLTLNLESITLTRPHTDELRRRSYMSSPGVRQVGLFERAAP
jgi:hypothetical protein